jgi:hypothetical protein
MKHALTILAWLILLALLVVGLRVARADAGPEDVVRETVDMVEVNHYYDEAGNPVFTQLMFLDWEPKFNAYAIVAWRLVKDSSQWPQRNYPSSGYRIVWNDNGVLRNVTAKAMSQTWSQSGVDGDPELNQRDWLPKEHRRELRAP